MSSPPSFTVDSLTCLAESFLEHQLLVGQDDASATFSRSIMEAFLDYALLEGDAQWEETEEVTTSRDEDRDEEERHESHKEKHQEKHQDRQKEKEKQQEKQQESSRSRRTLRVIQRPKPKGLYRTGTKIAPAFDRCDSFGAGLLQTPEAVRWASDFNVDLERRAVAAAAMRGAVQKYGSAEMEAITAGKHLLEVMNMRACLPFESGRARDTYSGTKSARYFYNSREGVFFMSASYKVRGTIEAAASYMFHVDRAATNPAFLHPAELARGGDRLKRNLRVVAEVNPHHKVTHQTFKFPPPLAIRDKVASLLWERDSDRSIIVVSAPLETHPLVDNGSGRSGDVVRGTMLAARRYTELDDGSIEVHFGVRGNFGGELPKQIVKRVAIPSVYRSVNQDQTHSMMSLDLEELTEADGKMLGEVLVNQIKQAKRKGGWMKRVELAKTGVDQFLYISVAMTAFLSHHPWFRSLLHTVASNHVSRTTAVKAPLDDLDDADAAHLGNALITDILSNTESAAAIDHWINQNACLGELQHRHPWARGFFVELAKYILATSKYGLVFRVSLGAALSIVDLATDIFMTVSFFLTEGQERFGIFNTILISLAIAVQVLSSWVNNHKKHSTFAKDAAIIFTGLKPAFDAYKIGAGLEREDHQLFDPLIEITHMKGVETVFEAIPSSVLQSYAYVTSKEKKSAALISIVVSAATVAFTSAMISYGKLQEI